MIFANKNSLKRAIGILLKIAGRIILFTIIMFIALNTINILSTCSNSRLKQKVPLISLIVNPWIHHNRCIQTIGIIEFRRSTRINLYPNSTSHEFEMFDSIAIEPSDDIKLRREELNGKHVSIDGVFDAFHLLFADSRRQESGYIKNVKKIKATLSFKEFKKLLPPSNMPKENN